MIDHMLRIIKRLSVTVNFVRLCRTVEGFGNQYSGSVNSFKSVRQAYTMASFDLEKS